MENSTQRPPFLEFDARTPEGLNLDFKRIVFRALRYWYLIMLSLLSALSIAFLINRYSERAYQVDASIIIRETQETSEGKLLYNNPLINPYRNYFNEIYIIRSHPLIYSVVNQYNFTSSFYREGNLLVTDAYHYVPMKAIFLRVDNSPTKFRIRMLDSLSYGIRITHENSVEQKYAFGDTVNVSGTELLVSFLDRKDVNGKPYQNEEFILSYSTPALVTSTYVSKLEASWAEQGSSVVNLAVKGTNPQKEIDFLNGLIERYQQYDLEKKNTTASRSVEFIGQQLAGIRDSLRFFEVQLEHFKDRNVVTDLSNEALRFFQKLEALEAQKSELLIRNQYYEYAKEYLSRNKEFDKIVLPGSVGITDPVLTELITQMITLQLGIKNYQSSSDRVTNPLVEKSKQSISILIKDIVESIETLKSTDRIKSAQLAQQIKDVEKHLKYLPTAERELIGIKRNYSLLDNLYVFLLQRMAEAQISQASTTSDIVVVNPAMVTKLISPKTRQNYLVAIVLGIVIPVVLFVLFEILNDKVQSKEDVEKITRIPFMGGVGHNNLNTNLAVESKPKSAVAEAFRAIRSNLNFFTGGQDKKIILITSSLSGEGKTFMSVNLATVLAMSGKKTIIIGADMRKPKIFNDFNLYNDKGLSTYLSGISQLSEIIQETSIANLYLISGGPVPPNPSELLLKDDIEKLLDTLKKEFDYVILDTPPVALVTDAFVLSKYADHNLFVVRQNYTPKSILKIINDYYTDGRVKNLSIILNDIYKSGPGYGYGYGYSYGYGYGYGVKKKKGGYYSE